MQSDLYGLALVLGAGVDGQAVRTFLEKQGMQVEMYEDDAGGELGEANLVFRSPGFPLHHPIVQEAKQKNIPITSSTAYFLQHHKGKTVGVTGSCGKTTCTALLEEMLKAQYGEEHIARGGNDAQPRLDLLGSETMALMELSSFQMIDCSVSPNVAVVLNVSPNHLDWHSDMQEYIEAKRQIVAHQHEGDIAVLNQHDPIVQEFAKSTKANVHWLQDMPKCTVLCLTHPQTLAAAVTAARALKVDEERIVRVLEEFPGVPHRLEFVREVDGIKFYNDSSCTTPESAITACEAFPSGSVMLLLGGRDKGMDFSQLYEVIKERDVRVVPYGEMATVFVRNIPVPYCLPPLSSLEDAVQSACSVGRPHVVLSPACSSFDLFKNAKERGAVFERIVKGL